MSKKPLLTCISLYFAITISGCATLFGDATQGINVRTSDGRSLDATLESGQQFAVPGIVTIAKDGSDPVKIITNEAGCAPVTTC